MNYPTMEEVEAASDLTLARWLRFLPSPGSNALDSPNFREIMNKEAEIQKRIIDRFKELGGMTTEISKAIGWEP